MKILLTGANGYLGNILKKEFLQDDLSTLGRSVNNNFNLDITQKLTLLPQFDLVIHAAGKAHVIPKSIKDVEDFFLVNVKGTENLLASLAANPPKAFVLISSVSVYGIDLGENINEEIPLLAEDPYGKSKKLCEQLVIDWCKLNNVVPTVLRLPLIAGPNPPGNLGAMLRALKNKIYFNIDGGKALRSIVLGHDVADAILKSYNIGGIYNLTDGVGVTYGELSNYICDQLNLKKPLNMPLWIAQSFAIIGNFLGNSFPFNTVRLKKMQSSLTFSDTKARLTFGWNPKPVIGNYIP